MSIKEELKEAGLKPSKGQHFLTSSTTIIALVEASDLERKETLEIGPGTGQITKEILERTEKLTVIEKEAKLAHFLANKFPDLDIIEEDFLQHDLEENNYERCISNVPFEISSEILEKLGENQIRSTLILQNELVDKIVADPGDKNYGFSTIKTQLYFLPVKLSKISADKFYPKPETDAAIVKLYPKKDRFNIKDENQFLNTTKALFTHKRKKLRNSFVDARHMLDYQKDKAKEIRDDLPHSEQRVINLDIKQLSEINNFIKSDKN